MAEEPAIAHIAWMWDINHNMRSSVIFEPAWGYSEY